MQRRYARDPAETQVQDTVMLDLPTQPDELQAQPADANVRRQAGLPPWVWVALGAGGTALLFWLFK